MALVTDEFERLVAKTSSRPTAVMVFATEALEAPDSLRGEVCFKHQPKGVNAPWTVNLREVSEGSINAIVADLQDPEEPKLKKGWFVSFVADDYVKVVFRDRTFGIAISPQGNVIDDGCYGNFQLFAQSAGITDKRRLDLNTVVSDCRQWEKDYLSGHPPIYRVEYVPISLQPELVDKVVRTFPPVGIIKIESGGTKYDSYLAEVPYERLPQFVRMMSRSLQPREWYALAIGKQPGQSDLDIIAVLPGRKGFRVNEADGLARFQPTAHAIGVSDEALDPRSWITELSQHWQDPNIVPEHLNNTVYLNPTPLPEMAVARTQSSLPQSG